MTRIGIECEQLEGKRFGVGHTLAQLLYAATKIPDVEKKYRFVLYFKTEIPNDAFLAHPLFEKKILTGGIISKSFNVFYHILLPVYSLKDRINCFFFPSYMLPAFFIGKAVVVLTNDVYWEAHYGSLPLKYRLAYKLFCWWAARRAKKIMTISQFAADQLRKFYGISEKRLFINPWGLEETAVELEKNDAYTRALQNVKEKMKIREEFFISVGQAFPRRHVREAVEAFGMIAEKYPHIQYCVACTDKYEPPVLDALINGINAKAGREAIVRAHYIDRSDLVYLMNNTLGMIYVSDMEALGLPPLETLACGKPSVVADTPLAHELFGDEGFFVKDTNDPAAIAEQMVRLIEQRDDVQRIVALQCPKLARLSWDTHVARLLILFDDVARL